MKKLKKVLLLVGILLINNLSYADGKTVTRSNCNGGGWKYKARSRVTLSGVPTTDKETKCYTVPYSQYPDTWAGNKCAYQWAINQWGNESQGGAVTRWYWICARGTSNSDLYYNLVESNLKSEPEGYEHSRVNCESTVFEKHKVIKKGIDASFTVLGKDLFSSLEIIMWLPEVDLDYVDSVPTSEKTFWRGKIELINGEVLLEGDFPKDSYKITERVTNEGVEYSVLISDMNIEVNYPEGITNEDLIEVVMITDAGIHEEIAINTALNLSKGENLFDLSIYPNPTTDFITISSNKTMNKELIIELYNGSGKLVTSALMNERNTYSFDFNLLNLKSGIFYVLIKDGEKSQMEKIIYTK